MSYSMIYILHIYILTMRLPYFNGKCVLKLKYTTPLTWMWLIKRKHAKDLSIIFLHIFSYANADKGYLRFPRCPNIIHTKGQYAVLRKNLQIEITYLTKSLNKVFTCMCFYMYVYILILTPRYRGRFMPQCSMQLVYKQALYIWQ